MLKIITQHYYMKHNKNYRNMLFTDATYFSLYDQNSMFMQLYLHLILEILILLYLLNSIKEIL